MVKLRLRRKGRKHYPVYDIVAVNVRARRDGAFLERLGYYNPNTHPNTIVIDSNRALYWLNVGAQPSPAVNRILSYEGILLTKHLKLKGKTDDEIAAEVQKHKEIVAARYLRRKELRKKRQEDKKKAEAKTNE
jgi:small subunit ribosomal protein S16